MTNQKNQVPRKTNNYVNNQDLLKAMIIYKDRYNQGLDVQGPEYDYIGECITLIAQKMGNHRWFIGYSKHWKEEMEGDAIENCIMYLHNFDPVKFSNPFAYLTQIVYFAYRRRLDKERKNQYVKMKVIEEFFIENDLSSEMGLETESLYDNNYDFIRKFEKDLTLKKKKSKVQGLEKFM